MLLKAMKNLTIHKMHVWFDGKGVEKQVGEHMSTYMFKSLLFNRINKTLEEQEQKQEQEEEERQVQEEGQELESRDEHQNPNSEVEEIRNKACTLLSDFEQVAQGGRLNSFFLPGMSIFDKQHDSTCFLSFFQSNPHIFQHWINCIMQDDITLH